MREQAFNELLDDLCGGILSKRERDAVREEMADHLREKNDELQKEGLLEDEAIKQAEKELGDRAELRRQLSLVHPYAPKISLRRAMFLLMLGFLLSTVYIELFHGMQLIFSFAGQLLTLTATYCFAKANRKLNRAFLFRAYGLAAGTVSYAVAPIFAENVNFALISALPQIVLYTVSWILLTAGLRALTAPYAGTDEKPLRFTFVTVLWICANTVLPLIILVAPGSDISEKWETPQQTFTIEGPLSYAIVISAAVYLICTLQLLWRINGLLFRSDHDYDIEDSRKRKAAVFFGAALLCMCAVFAGNFVYLKQTPKPSVYERQEVSLSDGERAALRNKLVAYSVPEAVADILPDEELLRYQSVPEIKDGVYKGEFSSSGENSVRVDEYVMPCTDDTGAPCFRFLRHIHVTYGARLRGAYFLNPYQGMTPSLSGSEFLFIRRTQDRKSFFDEPLRVYMNDLGVISGFDFQQGDEVDIIFSTTYSDPGEKMNVGFSHNIILYPFPVLGMNRTPHEARTYYNTAELFLTYQCNLDTAGTIG